MKLGLLYSLRLLTGFPKIRGIQATMYLFSLMTLFLLCNCVVSLTPRFVIYLPNGAESGTVPVDTNEYSQGNAVIVLGNTGNLSRAGYVFSGWNTMADGTGTNFAAGASMIMPAMDVSLYAIWLYSLADLGPPIECTISLPSESEISLTQAFTASVAYGVSFSVSLASDCVHADWYVDGNSLNGNSAGVLIDTSSLSVGLHELTVVIEDSLGLESSASFRFSVSN